MNDKNQNAGLFGLGEANTAYQQYFTGNSYLNGLVAAADEIDVTVANVTFEPGCRNNWHIHHHGFQILLVTSGEGWYQEAGKPAQLLHPGDVVTIHEGV
ncbi:double-stranded beta-helix-like protein, partial [Lacticaseibacillus paracasei subsp. paracasei Lpp70]